MAQRKQTDWAAVEQDYLSSGDSLRKIAQRYALAPTTVTRKAKQGNWAAKREQFESKRLSTWAETEGKIQGEAMAVSVRACVEVAMGILSRIRQDVENEKLEISAKDYRSYSGAVRDIYAVVTGDLDIDRKREEIRLIQERVKFQERVMNQSKEDKVIQVLLGDGQEYVG